MSTEAMSADGASVGRVAFFVTVVLFGIAAAIAVTFGGHFVQPLGSPQAVPPAASTPAPEEPSEPTAEEPAPAPEPEPSTQPAPEPEEPAVPVDLGPPTTELGILLVEEFGPETTFWSGGKQILDPEKGGTFRSVYLPTSYVGELAQRYVGTDDYWLLVETNSEAEGLEVLIKR